MNKLSPEQLALERARQAYSDTYLILRNAARDLSEDPRRFAPGEEAWRQFIQCAVECERRWNIWQGLARRATRPAKSILGCT